MWGGGGGTEGGKDETEGRLKGYEKERKCRSM